MTPIQFDDFIFKLVVVDKLMFQDRVLPEFDLAALEKALGEKLYERGSWKVPDDDYEGMVPQIRRWFEDLQVSAEQVAGIEHLGFGGARIQLVVAPNWGGENDLFDLTVASAADVHLLPSLKRVEAIFDLANGAAVVSAFAAKGVVLKHSEL